MAVLSVKLPERRHVSGRNCLRLQSWRKEAAFYPEDIFKMVVRSPGFIFEHNIADSPYGFFCQLGIDATCFMEQHQCSYTCAHGSVTERPGKQSVIGRLHFFM